MREIKFRAWDEKEKCWVSGFAIHQSGMFSDWAGCKKINGQCVAEADWKYQHEIPHIKIMQYTGLKDKNGKEIYEGDIIEFDKWMPNETFVRVIRGEVYWSNKGYWAVRNKDGKFLELLGRTENPEQIGNIYESPELLKGDENE